MTKTTENTTQNTKETTTDDVNNTPQDRNNEKKMIKFINSVVEKGYSPETAETLWESSCQREVIRNDPNLSDEERKEANKEKTLSSKRKKNTVKLTPTHNNMDENKTPIISLYDIKKQKLRA